MTHIDVYRVGVLAVGWRLLRAYRTDLGYDDPRKVRRWAWRNARAEARTVARHIRTRKWRELKNDFNGYLAEPYDWPAGLTRCGTGWTRRRALRSLERRARQPGIAWEQLQPSIDRELGR